MKKRLTYINEEFVDHEKAFVHVDDRAYYFADGVYEVVLIVKGKVVDMAQHMKRIEDSCKAINISSVNMQNLQNLVMEAIRVNNLKDGSVYFQISRGVAPRHHDVPESVKPNILITVTHGQNNKQHPPISAMLQKDFRWNRCNVKSISLLANIVARNNAQKAGFDESIFYTENDGLISESSRANIFMVTKSGSLVTPKLSSKVLAGTVRKRMLEIASNQLKIETEERDVDASFLSGCSEVFLSSSTIIIQAVNKIVNESGLCIFSAKYGNNSVNESIRQLYWQNILSGSYF